MASFLSNLRIFFNNKTYPQFLIIGVQKAGTTTLYDILNSNQNFCGSLDKETGFFTNDIFYNQGQAWYSKQFKQCNAKAIKFEATPFYLYQANTAKRIHSFKPDMKFIVVLREPASRCYSAWNMFRRFNATSATQIYKEFVQYSNADCKEAVSHLLFTQHYPTFKQAVKEDIERYLLKSDEVEPSFVRRGIYFEQIANYLNYFDIENFLFLEQKELNSPIDLMRQISDFFKVKINTLDVANSLPSNVGGYPEESIDVQETLKMLKEFYRPHNELLYNQIGIHYDWNESVKLK